MRVDLSRFELTCEWLTKHGVKFEVVRYFGSTHQFARFDFISAPQSIIDVHNTKFNKPVVDDSLFHEIEFFFYGLEQSIIEDIAAYYEITYTTQKSLITAICRIACNDESLNYPSEIITELKFIVQPE